MRNRVDRTGLDNLLPPERDAAPSSIIADVIATDRERSGRPHPARRSETLETNVTTLQRSNEETSEQSNVRTVEPSDERTNAETNVSDSVGAIVPDKPASGDNNLDARRDRAIRMASEDEIAVVTVRVSSKLNDYMDRYVNRINQVEPKRKYRKQDAVAEAFAAFFAEHPLPPAPQETEL